MIETHRPISTLSRTLVVLLAIGGALGALGALLGLVQGIAFPELAGLEEPQTGSQTAMMVGVACQALVYLFVYIATFIVFAMFTHRSCHNAHALGARGMEFTPGWAVGWYFIPFLNLFKPYQAVQEMYQALDPEAGSDDWRLLGSVPGFVGWWWAAWIVSNILGGIIGRGRLQLGPVGARRSRPGSTWWTACWTSCSPSWPIVVVRSLTARQERKARVASFA